MSGRVRVDGKHFACGDRRFRFRGVTYGTFEPRGDGCQFPEREQAKEDFAAMREAGFSVVRTYTLPPDDLVELAADWGLRLLPDVFYPDWRYLVGASRRQQGRVAKEARLAVRAAALRLAGSEEVLALSLGNEVPADVLRWLGTSVVARTIEDLADVVREADPDRLVTYANYPTAEYLPLDALDFLTFNVFLESRTDFRRYLTRLHHLAGDRPLVLGEVGFDAGSDAAGEQRQAEVLDWQLETAMERGVAGSCIFSWTDEWWVGGAAVRGWHFGLTRADRSPRPALRAAEAWNSRTVADLDFPWPSTSVVICAYNAAATLDECLRHSCALEYPGLEVIVVDDGSTDATPEIVRRHRRARLVSVPHGGLSVARNAGFEAARGELVAYLDSDAYPSPEWPYYLALALDGRTVAGSGGPNLPPPDDDLGAHQVARAPGGPVHVLLSDDRAEHVPGCNLAFWKQVLVEVGGFDPVYTAAGDDVDLCWRVLDRGWDIGFHPAALVWHHRRPGLGAYLRQQRGYGRSEALVEARHPDRFTSAGTARWRGHIYDSFAPSLTRQRVYRGAYGAAAYQSVYHSSAYGLDLAHQVGVPLAALVLMTAPLALASPFLAVPALGALLWFLGLGAVDAARFRPPRGLAGAGLRFRLGVAAMHLLQPLARSWGRTRHRTLARADLPLPLGLPGPVRKMRGGVLLFPHDRSRAELAEAVVGCLRQAGLRVATGQGWEEYDARVLGSALIAGDVVTSAHPVGHVQLRIRPRLRWRSAAALLLLAAVAASLSAVAGGLLMAAGAIEVARGLWRVGAGARRAVRRGAGADVVGDEGHVPDRREVA